MIDINSETLIAFREVPQWCEQTLGKRISPATIFRWRLRGVRGVKLETLLVGGTRFTSIEALHRFIEGTTVAADGSISKPASPPVVGNVDEAYRMLENDGI